MFKVIRDRAKKEGKCVVVVVQAVMVQYFFLFLVNIHRRCENASRIHWFMYYDMNEGERNAVAMPCDVMSIL